MGLQLYVLMGHENNSIYFYHLMNLDVFIISFSNSNIYLVSCFLQAGNLNMKILCTPYGREDMKKTRTSPDAYVQVNVSSIEYYI